MGKEDNIQEQISNLSRVMENSPKGNAHCNRNEDKPFYGLINRLDLSLIHI